MAPAASTNVSAAEEASKSLKCKTWVLKVFIHCEGCKRQVKKALQSIDGVYTTTVDSQQHKVTVVGNIDSVTLIKKLSKAGKNAEIWPENSPAKCNNNKQAGDKQQNDTKKPDTNNSKNAGEPSGKKGKNDTQGKPPADNKDLNSSVDNKKKKGNDSPAAPGEKQQGGGANAGKKNKNQGGDQKLGSNNNENGAPIISSGSFNPNQVGGDVGACAGHGLNHPHLLQQQSYSYPFYAPNQAPQAAAPVYVLSYSNAPSPYGKDHTVSYQVPASSICLGTQQPQLLETNAPLEAVPRFDVFSEENPNGCSIM